MKKIILLLFVCVISTAVFSQVENHNGSQNLKIGANIFGDNLLKVNYNYGLTDMFSVGAGVYAFNDSYAFIRGDFYLGAVVTLPDNLGAYAAIELGVLGNDKTGESMFLNFDPQIGIAYSISQNIDLFMEFSGGGLGTLGVSFNF